MVASFAAAGAAVVFLFELLHGDVPGIANWKLGLRFAVFGGVSFVCLALLSRLSPERASHPEETGVRKPFQMADVGVLAAVLLLGFAAFQGLDRYPRAEPDELHHLIVSRNLAEYGVYASGRPEQGFVRFDPYDSVGPSVIVPVAAGFVMFGARLETARGVIAVSFVGMCLALYLLVRSMYTPWTGLIAVLLSISAVGSLYLGRTLYGEVPAAMYLLCGCIVMQRGRHALRPARLAYGIMAGLFFGLAVLAKYFLIVLLFPLVWALLYDWQARRLSSLVSTAGIVLGAAVPIVLWQVCQFVFADSGSGSATGMGSFYMHYLLIGPAGIRIGLANLVDWVLPCVVLGVALAYAIPRTGSRSCDPVSLALWLTIVFVLAWFLLFTPGQIIRYVWYAFALGTVFIAPLMVRMAGMVLEFRRRPGLGLAGLGVIGLTLAGMVQAVAGPLSATIQADDMKSDRAMADFLRELDTGTHVASTYYTIPRIANFFADRPVSRVPDSPDSLDDAAVVLVAPHQVSTFTNHRPPDRMIGEYGVYFNDIR
ncbi:MAG: hypothetical protein AMXMBFR84_17710 [Candidatus Hydrogenedentota bacterium]